MLPEDTPRSNEPNSPELAVIFVDKASVSELLWQRLPPLIHAHDARTQSDPKTRLVSLPKGAEARMSEALGIPRVSILGLPRGVPGAERLLRLCEKVVEPVVIQGLSDIQAGRYFPVSISVETKEVSVIKKTPKPDIKAKA
jgi:ribonuclease P/MRP protein subunit POP3